MKTRDLLLLFVIGAGLLTGEAYAQKKSVPPEPVFVEEPLDVGTVVDVEKWMKRAVELRGRTEALTPAEMNDVSFFLLNVVKTVGMTDEEADGLRGALIDRLEHEATRERFADVLLKVQADERHRDKVRYIAVRQLTLHYTRFPHLEPIQDALLVRCQDLRGLVGPTALFGLKRMDADGALTPEGRLRLQQTCRKLLASNASSEMVKMISMEILRRVQDTEALRAARESLQNNSSIALKTAALGAIGEMGDTKDLAMLVQSPLREEKALKNAFTAAIENIGVRTGNAEKVKPSNSDE